MEPRATGRVSHSMLQIRPDGGGARVVLTAYPRRAWLRRADRVVAVCTAASTVLIGLVAFFLSSGLVVASHEIARLHSYAEGAHEVVAVVVAGIGSYAAWLGFDRLRQRTCRPETIEVAWRGARLAYENTTLDLCHLSWSFEDGLTLRDGRRVLTLSVILDADEIAELDQALCAARAQATRGFAGALPIELRQVQALGPPGSEAGRRQSPRAAALRSRDVPSGRRHSQRCLE